MKGRRVFLHGDHPAPKWMLSGLFALSAPVLAFAQSASQIESVTVPEIGAIENAKAARTGIDKKISSQLLEAYQQQRNGKVNPAVPNLKAQSLPGYMSVPSSGELPSTSAISEVDIDAKSKDEVFSAITKNGGQVESAYEIKPNNFQIRALIPIESVKELAAQPDVMTIQPAAKSSNNASQNLADNEGVIAHSANRPRSFYFRPNFSLSST